MSELSATVERRVLRDWSGGETATCDELVVRFGCGDWETVLDPAGFGGQAEWHRRFCGVCAGEMLAVA